MVLNCNIIRIKTELKLMQHKYNIKTRNHLNEKVIIVCDELLNKTGKFFQSMTEFVKLNGKFILKNLFSGYVTVLGQLHKSNHIDCDSTHPPFLMSANPNPVSGVATLYANLSQLHSLLLMLEEGGLRNAFDQVVDSWAK